MIIIKLSPSIDSLFFFNLLQASCQYVRLGLSILSFSNSFLLTFCHFEDISVFLVDIISQDIYDIVVIVDAIDSGSKPGTLLVTSEIADYVRPLTSHSIPLPEIKFLIEKQNKQFLFIGAQAKTVEFLKEPSLEIHDAVDEVLKMLV